MLRGFDHVVRRVNCSTMRNSVIGREIDGISMLVNDAPSAVDIKKRNHNSRFTTRVYYRVDAHACNTYVKRVRRTRIIDKSSRKQPWKPIKPMILKIDISAAKDNEHVIAEERRV